MKPIHSFRTTGVRVIRGGYPIVAECGHVNGIAFGVTLKVVEDLRDCPTYDTAARIPPPPPDWSMGDLARLRSALEVSAS